MDVAVKLFNDGIIHRYVHKNEPNYLENLVKTISELQHEYFVDLSQIIINALAIKPEIFELEPPSCLNDPVFIRFFDEFIKKQKITEYYLLDEMGSFLFLDENGKLSWLVLNDEDLMEATEFEIDLENVKINPQLAKSIHNRGVLRYVFNHDEYPAPENIDKVVNLFYPATKLVGKTNYYYSYIEKPLMNPTIDTSQIISYHDYRSKMVKKK
ncbi:MAG TPA: hypothetical protein VHZ76_08575 [Gammaproteobacteria bacterium]|nr:hypothetical protein [Gammaproteobacteria bacterium]